MLDTGYGLKESVYKPNKKMQKIAESFKAAEEKLQYFYTNRRATKIGYYYIIKGSTLEIYNQMGLPYEHIKIELKDYMEFRFCMVNNELARIEFIDSAFGWEFGARYISFSSYINNIACVREIQ